MGDTITVPLHLPAAPVVAVVGQSPGRDEAREGRPFVGKAGKVLRRWLREAGLDPDAQVMYTNVTDQFYPWDPNHVPKGKEAKEGYARVMEELELAADTLKAILLVGAPACHMVFKGNMGAMVGRVDGVYLGEVRVPAYACYHPSYYLRSQSYRLRAEIEGKVMGVLAQVMQAVRGEAETLVLSAPRYVDNWEVTDGAIDVETLGEKRSDTSDPRRAIFHVLANAPHNVVTFDLPRIKRGSHLAIHNTPYDAVVCGEWDCEWEDTKMLGHLAGLPDTTLKGMTVRELGRPAMGYAEAKDLGHEAEYCYDDARNTYDLVPVLKARLRPETLELYETLEKPLLPLWAKMTLEGSFHLDLPGLEEYREVVAREEEEALSQVLTYLPPGRTVSRCRKCRVLKERLETGQRCEDGKNHGWDTYFDEEEPINVGSWQQLLPALQAMGLDVGSTAEEELAHISHPVIDALLTYREKAKVVGTYLDPWLEVAREGKRLGSVWRPTGARTGRVASAKPNLQNVPNDLERFFLTPEDGYTLLTWDNSQLEVRIAAHISQDPDLIRVCHSEDLHGTLQQVLGAPSRRDTKVWIFGSMYFGGPAAIINQAAKFGLKMDVREALRIQSVIKKRMPYYFQVWGPSQFDKDVIEGLFGRWHHLPPDGNMVGMSVNSPIQGGAGDVTKYQMLALWRAGYWVVRQVHDSVTLAIPNGDVEDAKVEVPRIMEQAAPPLDVPIRVELK